MIWQLKVMLADEGGCDDQLTKMVPCKSVCSKIETCFSKTVFNTFECDFRICYSTILFEGLCRFFSH